MKQLAESSTDLRALERTFAFISCVADFDKNHSKFDGGFLLWADTENALTSARLLPNAPRSSGAQVVTAFSVMKKVPDDWRSPKSDPVLNECEELAWHIIQKIRNDSDPSRLPCASPFFHVDTSSIQLERDGPYYNDHMGVTVRITVHVETAVPKYDAAKWTAAEQS